MLGINRGQRIIARLLALLLIGVVGAGLVSCNPAPRSGTTTAIGKKPFFSRLTEVAPPAAIRELDKFLAGYQPQVKIVAPRPNEVLQDTQVTVRLQINDLPLFKDDDYGLGPHLQVVLDNQTYSQIYDVSQPLLIEDLTPGTHTLRVFAVRPWHESFKNEGAYAQTTFHVFTPTPDNAPDPQKPLLTYNAPLGVYGAEPVLLDFYLTNAPLHLVAQDDPNDEILDWQIRCTINGESFTFDRWEPIYLIGLKPGKNWVQLELLDERGNAIANAYNNTVHLVTYEPGGRDPLAQLIRGELSPRLARSIVDPNYVYVPEPEPEPEPERVPEPEAAEEEPPLAPEAAEELPEPELVPETPAVEEPELTAPQPPEVLKTLDEVDQPGDERLPIYPSPETLPEPETLPPTLPEVLPPTPGILDATPGEQMPASPVPAELEMPAVATPVEIESEPVEPLKTLIPDLVTPATENGMAPAPVGNSPVLNPVPLPAEPEPLPDTAVSNPPSASGLLPLFDQVKGFFEGLRRRPAPAIEAPLLVPAAEPVAPTAAEMPSSPTAAPVLETPAPNDSIDSDRLGSEQDEGALPPVAPVQVEN